MRPAGAGTLRGSGGQTHGERVSGGGLSAAFAVTAGLVLARRPCMHCWCCLLCTCIALVLSMLLHAVERGHEQSFRVHAAM